MWPLEQTQGKKLMSHDARWKTDTALSQYLTQAELWGRKHCEKRRNYLLQAISPFLTMFSTAIYLYSVKM